MKYKGIFLVRSPKKLIEKSRIGYGWSQVDFSQHSNSKDLLENGFKKQGINVGRKTKQIRRYFNLKEGDLVIIPVSGAVALAKIEGKKLFKKGVKYGQNQIEVSYFKTKDGDIAFIPRASLTTALQSRLKLRMSNASLEDFRDELEKLAISLEKGEIYTWKTAIEEKEEKAEKEFKQGLLEKIRKGKVGLSAGGYGLEKLVRELLITQGYEAKIQAKNQSSGIDDIDIIAKRVNLLTNDVEALYIQVKHHKGNTSIHGIKQLEAFDVSDDIAFYRKILITTGDISEKIRKNAEKYEIIILDGKQFVNWLYGSIEDIRTSTKTALGISSIPSLL